MLVLSRKLDESIILDGKIEIKVLAIEEGKIKLGIKAPKEIEIYRKEIYIEIEQENKAASQQQNAIEKVKQFFKR